MKILKIGILLVVLFTTTQLMAANIIVTNVNDSGANSFRWAVNNASSGDTIIIDVKGIITVNSVINFTTNNLTIIGPYPKHNAFSTNNNRLFNFSNVNNIKIKGIGVVNSNTLDTLITINNSTNITFIDCLFESNNSVSVIHSDTSQITIQNSAFINNNNTGNGTVSMIGDTGSLIVNCTFYSNNTIGNMFGAFGKGGAIYFGDSANVDLINNMFHSNYATTGQALYAVNGSGTTIYLYNNAFTSNGSGQQISQITGNFNDQGGNLLVLNSGETVALYNSNSNSLSSGTSLNITPTPIEDGYGLKYFKLTPSSLLIGYGVSLPITLTKDCRRAPRVIGTIDTGPVEYTSARVTNTYASGSGSLAIEAQGGGYIEFNLPSFDPATDIIVLDNTLFLLIDNTYIDGYSQEGTAIPGPGTTPGTVTPADSLIQIKPSTSMTNVIGIQIGNSTPSNNATISGLEIHSFTDVGVYNENGNNFNLFGCHIGFYNDYTSNSYTLASNDSIGVKIEDESAVIGGIYHYQRNVISENGVNTSFSNSTNSNVYIGSGANYCKVLGNFIGPSPDGNTSINLLSGGFSPGVMIDGATNTTIGISNLGGRNIISANKNDGIQVLNSASNCKIDNNIIGLGYNDTTTNLNIGNLQHGIYINNTSNPVLIGLNKGNIISANSLTGIKIENSNGTLIQNNLIGITTAGVSKGNTIGVEIIGNSQNNIIGGLLTSQNNVISGNTTGIKFDGSSVQNNKIGGNFIGLFYDGSGTTIAVPNTNGIKFLNGANNNEIGQATTSGAPAFYKNIISSNTEAGIYFDGVSSNRIYRNYIGSDSTLSNSFQNQIGVYVVNCISANNIGIDNSSTNGPIISGNVYGIVIDNSSNQLIQNCKIGSKLGGMAELPNLHGIVLKNNSTSINIGQGVGSNPYQGNVISGNDSTGISILSNSNDNFIEGNKIGTGGNGLIFLPNEVGVYVNNSSSNNIGPNNLISGNIIGIELTNSANNNKVEGNLIGTDIAGTNALADSIGVKISSGASSNTIGGDLTDILKRNVISGNSNYGIRILDVNTDNNEVKGNFIGVDTSGNSLLGNNKGIGITSGAQNNIIGGANSTDKNIICGNSDKGIAIADSGTDNNQILNNNIGLAYDNTTILGNDIGIAIFDSSTGNKIRNANYICGNGYGVYLQNTSYDTIQNNFIGVKPNNSPGGNTNSGIFISGSLDNEIGGTGLAEGNVIAHNGGDGISIVGVSLTSSNNNQILGNSIYNNSGLAIDIDTNGVTTNGASGNQNGVQMPEILQAFDCNNNGDAEIGVVLKGLLNGVDYSIEFYDNSAVGADPTTYGEAHTFLQRFSYSAGPNSIDTVVFNLSTYVPNTTLLSASLTALNVNGGTTSEMSKNVTVVSTPTLLISTTDETCNGSNDGSITIDENSNATPAYYYALQPDVPQFNPTLDTTFSLTPGSYTVNYKYLNGCSKTIIKTINAGPTPTFSVNVLNHDTCGFGGLVEIDTSLNTVGSNVSFIDVINGTTQTSNQFTNLNSGTYQFAIITTIGTSFCYSDTTTVTVNEINLANNGEMNFIYNDFCAGTTGVVTTPPNYTGGIYQFNPTPSNGELIDPITGNITNATAINTTYKVEYAYGTCITQQNPTAIDVTDASFSYNGNDSLCFGETINLNVTNSGGTFSLPASSLIDIDATTGVISNYNVGQYQVIYNTGGACPGEDTVTVTILALPTQPNITTLDSILCDNEQPTQLNVNQNVNWLKDSPNGQPISTGTSYQPTLDDLQFGVNTYYAYVIDANGCLSPYDSINIVKVNVNQLKISPDSIGICIGSEIEIFANDNALTYLWLYDNSTEQSIIVSPTQPTSYTVEMTDIYDCILTDSVYIYFKPQSECKIETYTAFSPNGDNVNDVWIIDGIEGYNENIVYIYNRWGDLIQKIENYDNVNNVWDGTTQYGEKSAVAGTYFYIVEANGTKALTGWVNIVK